MSDATLLRLSWLEWVLVGLAVVFGFLFGNFLGFFLFNAWWLWPLAVIALIYALIELFFTSAITGFWRLATGRKGPTREETKAEASKPQNRLIRRAGMVAMIGGFCIPLLQYIAGLMGLGGA
jgi:uncharacterized membrane protein YqjE